MDGDRDDGVDGGPVTAAGTGPRWTPPGLLDGASGLPLHPAAAAALDALRGTPAAWADPARQYAAGRRARLLLDGAHESLAASLGARPDEVLLTSSATTAVHLGVLGVVRARSRVGATVVAGAVEHSAVLHAARATGADPVLVPVSATGRVDELAWAAAVAAPGVAVAALQSANHEVGTLQPVAEAGVACRAAAVPLLVDAAAGVGYAPVPEGWDLLTASAHKWGGPPGVGVLAVRTGTRWRSPAPDDGRGPVPGFPTVAAAVAAAAALESVLREREETAARLRALVDRIRAQVAACVPDVDVVGEPAERLPHIVTFSCLYVDGEALMSALDREGFAISSGSACVADALVPSHVLAAMGALTQGNVRVSLPPDVTDDDVDRFLAVLPQVIARIRADHGVVGR